MPNTANMGFVYPTEGQATKATYVGHGLNQVGKALSRRLIVPSTGVTAGSALTIPFDDTNVLSEREALHSMWITVTAGATGAFNCRHPDIPHMFVIENQTAYDMNLRNYPNIGDQIIIVPGEVAWVHTDGTNFSKASEGFSVATADTDGSFVQHPNGVLECWVSGLACPGFVVWDFPKAFISAGTLAVQAIATDACFPTKTSLSTTQVQINAFSPTTPASTISTTIDIYAKGFWK